ncbi:MAG: hypothetical protein ABSG32_03890 [Terriglobia bacterium]|jgi:hypothetical protein
MIGDDRQAMSEGGKTGGAALTRISHQTWALSGVGGGAGLNRRRKNPSKCHPEEAKPTKDRCICLKVQMQGSFAALRMTAFKRLSAACEAPPFQTRGEKSGLRICGEGLSLRQVWRIVNLSIKTTPEARTQKISKMKVDSDKLLKVKRRIGDIMSEADDLMKIKDLQKSR